MISAAASWDEAWRHGAFCELGTGDVDLAGFVAELGDYSGWLVVEQDWVPKLEDSFRVQAEAQARNRHWVAEHARL